MEYQVVWTAFAKEQLKQIYFYYEKKASLTIAQKITNELVASTILLQKTPRVGQREELLLERKEEIRYLISKHNKIIYLVNDNSKQVVVLDVFDTRQNPDKIKLRNEP